MSEQSVFVDSITPLTPEYEPETLTDRDSLRNQLTDRIQAVRSESSKNLILQGPRGSGKTTVLRSVTEDITDRTPVCHIECHRHRTQYQVLQQLWNNLDWNDFPSGRHTSDLQRRVESRTSQTPLILILDELDFLLLNDGDELLYFLSRLEHSSNILVIGVLSSLSDVASLVDTRAYSSLYPEEVTVEPYTADDIYKLLAIRARQAFQPRSLHREAITYIASSTQNAAQAIHWLRTAAEESDTVIGEEVVRSCRRAAHQAYIEQLLEQFTEHHQTLHRITRELASDHGAPVRAGAIYEEYEQTASKVGEDVLSRRRISDFLKHLEALNLIQVDYYYGGEKGKTREITPKSFL